MRGPRTPAARRALQLYRSAPRADRLHVRGRWWTCPFPLVEREVPRTGRVLEVGCGHGLLSALVAATGPVNMPFFLGYGLRRAAFVGTEAACAAAVHITKTVVYGRYALVTPETGVLGLAMGAVMFVFHAR